MILVPDGPLGLLHLLVRKYLFQVNIEHTTALCTYMFLVSLLLTLHRYFPTGILGKLSKENLLLRPNSKDLRTMYQIYLTLSIFIVKFVQTSQYVFSFDCEQVFRILLGVFPVGRYLFKNCNKDTRTTLSRSLFF